MIDLIKLCGEKLEMMNPIVGNYGNYENP